MEDCYKLQNELNNLGNEVKILNKKLIYFVIFKHYIERDEKLESVGKSRIVFYDEKMLVNLQMGDWTIRT